MKWNMGWMHRHARLPAHDPLYRRFHHGRITFSLVILRVPRGIFVLPLSHDEVFYGKGSLIGMMPRRQLGACSSPYAQPVRYMLAHPARSCCLGGEFGQRREWTHEGELEWWVASQPEHEGLRRWVVDLNRLYRQEPALHELDFDGGGFQWVDADDSQGSVLSFLRKARDGRTVLVVCNFTPVLRPNYILGVPRPGAWHEVLNSDATVYGGSGAGNLGVVEATPVSAHGHFHSLTLTLPPLGVLFLVPEDGDADR